MSVQWENVGTNVCNINQAFPYSGTNRVDETKKKPAEIMAPVVNVAPQIMIQKPGSTQYEKYFYVANALLKDKSRKAGWCNEQGNYADSVNGGALPGNVTPSIAIWFKDPEHDEVAPVTSGQVINDDVEVNGYADFRLRAPAYPVTLNINDASQITFEGLDATQMLDETKKKPSEILAPVVNTAPLIMIQKPGSTQYEKYYYVGNAKKSDNSRVVGWCNEQGNYADSTNGGALPGNVAVGGGFWARGTSSTFTMTFHRDNE